jgi:hypothetical protein
LRTINAAQVRADFRAKRKLRGEDGEDGEDGQKRGKRRKIDGGGRDTQIRPGETLAHFNKCVGFCFPFTLRVGRVKADSWLLFILDG